MPETCENCGNTAMSPAGWNDWTCAECGYTQGQVLVENRSLGDLISGLDGGDDS